MGKASPITVENSFGRQRSAPWLRFVHFACLFVGIVEVAGALLWCVAGAGIYGSPLQPMIQLGSFKELSFILSIIVTGPVAALLAGLLSFWRPRSAARILFTGAALCAILGARYQEVGLLLAAIVSLPMCLVGLLLAQIRNGEATETTSFAHARQFQFNTMQLMQVITAVGLILGLAVAHAALARNQPYVRTPLVERLENDEFVPAGAPLETETGLLGRLEFRSGVSSDNSSRRFGFELNLPYQLPHRQLPPQQLMKRLRKEVEEQLNNDGGHILEITDPMGNPNQPAQGTASFRIKYRWHQTQGTFKAWSTGHNAAQVEIEESNVPSFLAVRW